MEINVVLPCNFYYPGTCVVWTTNPACGILYQNTMEVVYILILGCVKLRGLTVKASPPTLTNK